VPGQAIDGGPARRVAQLRRRWLGGRRPVQVLWLAAATGASGLVFPRACLATLEGATPSPLAFTIPYPVNRLAAGIAAVGCLVAARLPGRFIAPRPVAQRQREKIFAA